MPLSLMLAKSPRPETHTTMTPIAMHSPADALNKIVWSATRKSMKFRNVLSAKSHIPMAKNASPVSCAYHKSKCLKWARAWPWYVLKFGTVALKIWNFQSGSSKQRPGCKLHKSCLVTIVKVKVWERNLKSASNTDCILRYHGHIPNFRFL